MSGFRAAFLAAAIMMVLGAVLLACIVRRRHVTGIDERAGGLVADAA